MKIDQMFVLSNYRKSLARHDVWCETFLHTETQRRNETLAKELCELEETLEGANIADLERMGALSETVFGFAKKRSKLNREFASLEAVGTNEADYKRFTAAQNLRRTIDEEQQTGTLTSKRNLPCAGLRAPPCMTQNH